MKLYRCLQGFLCTMRSNTLVLVRVLTLAICIQAASVAEPELPSSFRDAGMTQLSDNIGPVVVKNDVMRMPNMPNGKRGYLRTTRSDWAQENFQAEVTVIVQGGDGPGCAFFGLGRGDADSAFFYEPLKEPVLYARLGPSNYANGAIWVWGSERKAQGAASIGDGRHRVRLTWDAGKRRALFEVDKNWDGKMFVVDAWDTIRAKDVQFDAKTARLFVGGSHLPGFADFSVQILTDAQIAAVDFHDRVAGEDFANDPTARTWMPSATATNMSFADDPANRSWAAQNRVAAAEIADLLNSLRARMRLLACWYEGSKLAATRVFKNGALQTQKSAWQATLQSRTVPGEKGALDLDFSFRLTSGFVQSAGVAVAFDFAEWSTENYVLIPASVYNGNRNRIVKRGYATGLDRADLYKKDLPLTTTELPQLAPTLGQTSKIEVSACNTTTPALCFFNPKTKRAFMVLAEQGIKIGDTVMDNGLSMEESVDRSRASFIISAPGVRERKPEFIGFGSSPDRGRDWKRGEEVKLRLRVYSFAAPDISALLDKFMTARKDVTGANQPRNLVPFSEVARLMTNRIDSRFHQGKEFQFYCPENAAWISFGWIGGLMNTFPMLALGDEMHLERVTKTFDFAMPRAQGKAGYFYGALNYDGKVFGREGYDEFPEIALTRKNGDVLYWMLKQLLLLKAQGRAAAIKPQWEQSVRRLSDAFVATWERDGQWGNLVNVDSGAVAVYNTSGGVSAIGGLTLAAHYFHQPEYLKIAQEAAGFYYERDFVKQGMTTGACADILQNADSETAAGFMTALMTLYEITGDARWLEKSRNLANLLATWTVSYDYELPRNTELGALGAKLAGTVWASTQNKHGAPGICTSAGEALLKIYRATGDRRYADLLRDIAHAHAEGIKPDGQITERLTYCDADSRGSRGGGSTGWNELNGILMSLELPGLYVRTDTGQHIVFDHVEVKTSRRDNSGVTLTLFNPTKFAARVAVLAESAQQAKVPLGTTSFLKWPHVEVPAGASVTIRIGNDGVVNQT